MNPFAASQLSLPYNLVLPIETHLNLPFVQGELDGKPTLLLVDSGAPDIMLQSHHLPPEKLTLANEMMGVSGKVQSFLTTFDELSIGDWKIGPREVRALDDSPLEEAFGVQYAGLIGFRQLIHFDWMIDYQKMEMHLWQEFKQKEHQVPAQLRVRYLNNLPLFPVTIGGQTYQLLLDTGASDLVMDQSKKAALDSQLTDLKTDALQGAGGKTVESQTGTLAAITVAEQEIENINTVFSNLSPLKARLGEFDGIIGFPLLSKTRMVVSWERKRFFFLENENNAAAE